MYFRYTIDQKLKQLREDEDATATSLSEQIVIITSLVQRTNELSASISELQSTVSSLQTSLNAHTQAINNALSRIQTLETKVEDHERRIQALENQ